MFQRPSKHVILVYSHFQKLYEEMYGNGVITKMIEGYTNYEELKELIMSYKQDGGSFLILDDQLSNLNSDIMKIFFELSHHGNCTVFMISQNLFFSSRKFRSISLNSNYLFILKNPRDQSQILSLAKQYLPYRPSFLIEAFQDSIKKPHGYLCMDFTQNSSDLLRFVQISYLKNGQWKFI